MTAGATTAALPPAGRRGPALLVVGHGSRDPAAGAEFDRLVAGVAALLPGTAVGAGYLELAEPHVDDAVDALVAGGATDVVAVPLVLFGAGHLKDDGPALLGRARRRHPEVRFRLARDLGIHPTVLAVAEDRARAALPLQAAGRPVPRGGEPVARAPSGAQGAAAAGDGQLGKAHAVAGPAPDSRGHRVRAGLAGRDPLLAHEPAEVDQPGAALAAAAPRIPSTATAAAHTAPGSMPADAGAQAVADAVVTTAMGGDGPVDRGAGGAAVVLVGRGSTDPDACAELVKFARLVEDGRGLGSVEAAFAAMSGPDVEEALERCRRLGAHRIAVVPLFLFAGVIVDRVAERTGRWAAAHPEVEVTMGSHLGPDPRLAALVVERHREAIGGDVRMNCDVCVYRVRLPGFEEKVGTPLSLGPTDRPPRGWRARRAANQDAERAAERRARPRRGLGRRHASAPAPDRNGPAVRVSGLAHTFPDGTTALAGVDLVVEQGQRVALLGPNGSGKTTLALHLIGALDRQAGTVTVTGLDVVRANLAEVRRRVGLVFQDPDDQLLLPTVADDVALGPRNLGLADREVADRVTAALDVVGLTDLADRAPQHLSLGERRRAALAGVLAMHPEVLVLDEPSANLDPAARRDLVEIVGGLDVTTLVITHDLSLALELCPRSVVLDHGVVAADGATRALLSNPGLLEAHRLDLPYGMVVPP